MTISDLLENAGYFYLRLLHFGFMNLQHSFALGDLDWISAEVEFLHNIPSLIGEGNINRHEYFWISERTSYINWILNHSSEEAKARFYTLHEPILLEMEPTINRLIKEL